MAKSAGVAGSLDPLRRFYWILVAVLGGGLTAVYLGVPQWRGQFQDENQFLENLSALFFLASFLLGTLAYRQSLVRRKAWFCACIPLLGLFGFLDEVHFGSDWFDFDPILLWGSDNYRIDGVHDLFTLPFKLWRDLPRSLWDYGIASLLGLTIGLAVVWRRAYMPWVMRQVHIYPCFDYLRMATILIFFALVLDLDVFDHHVAIYMEELLETLGGFTLCFASLSLHGMFDPGAKKENLKGREVIGEALVQTHPGDRLKKLLVVIVTAEIGLLAYVLFIESLPRVLVQEFGPIQMTQNLILLLAFAITAYQVWRCNNPRGGWCFLLGLALFFFWRELDIDREYFFVEYKNQGINVRAFTLDYLFMDIPLWIKLTVGLPSAALMGLWIHGLWKFRSSLWSAVVFLYGKRPFGLFITSMLVLAISQFGYFLPGVGRNNLGPEEVAELLGETLFLFAVLDLHLRLGEFAPGFFTSADR